MAKIAFIGLGNMGSPMAANLLQAQHQVIAFDLSEAVVDAAVDKGATRAAAAAEAVKAAEVVVTMLPAGKHVRDVYENAVLGNAARGALLIDCSTIDVESARHVAALAAKAGFDMVDAPVSGGVGGAAAGTLTFMVGGSETAFARGLPVLQAMGKNIVHAGGPGAGQAAKICNNMMLAINMVGVSEGFLLARKLGLDWDKLFEIASTSSGQSWAMTSYCPAPGPVPAAPSNRDYAAGFMAALMLKDVKLSQQAADAAGSPTPLAAHAMSFYQAVVDAGDGAKDFSVVFRWLAAQSRQ